MNIQFDSYWELLALHRSLMTVKFDRRSCLPDAQGSPYTASLSFKVFELLVSQCRKESDDEGIKEWLEWQKADMSRDETQFLLEQIEKSERWKTADESQRERHINNFMAPLILTEEYVKHIIHNC